MHGITVALTQRRDFLLAFLPFLLCHHLLLLFGLLARRSRLVFSPPLHYPLDPFGIQGCDDRHATLRLRRRCAHMFEPHSVRRVSLDQGRGGWLAKQLECRSSWLGRGCGVHGSGITFWLGGQGMYMCRETMSKEGRG